MPPPPDTVYIHGKNGAPPSTGDARIDSIIQAHWNTGQVVSKADDVPFDGPVVFLVFVVGFLMAYFSNLLRMLPDYIRKKQALAKVKKLVKEKGMEVDQLLTDCNPYYRSLPVELKQRFLERTLHFAESKNFRYHAIEEKGYIPYLISGSAVQLTFGLQNYLMDYFDTIHVMKGEYVLNLDNETYLGHVSRNGIHISWKHFLAGYYDYSDSINLGLHEMAHALQFDAYLGFENKYDRHFKERLNEFAEEGRPVFRAMRAGEVHLFDHGSVPNFDEFWAVSVENFFENTALFKEKLPALYTELSELLNQDPLLDYKIIDPDLL